MATDKSVPSFARDILPLFRETSGTTMMSVHMHRTSSNVWEMAQCLAMASGPRSRSLNLSDGWKLECQRRLCAFHSAFYSIYFRYLSNFYHLFNIPLKYRAK